MKEGGHGPVTHFVGMELQLVLQRLAPGSDTGNSDLHGPLPATLPLVSPTGATISSTNPSRTSLEWPRALSRTLDQDAFRNQARSSGFLETAISSEVKH